MLKKGGYTMTDQTAKEKKFKAIETQEELDKVVDSRLARERAKYADYEDLKTIVDSRQEELDKAAAENEELKNSLSAVNDELAAYKKGIQVATWKNRAKVALNLPDDADEFIRGDTEEAIMKSARDFAIAAEVAPMWATRERADWKGVGGQEEDPLTEFFRKNVTR